MIVSKRLFLFYWAYVCLALTFFSTDSWAQVARLPISVTNSTAAPLVDYTVRLELNATNAPGFDFNNNGDGIQVVNGDETATLDFYVESVDPVTDVAVVWVQVPAVPVSPPDTQFFLDYGLTLPSPLSNAETTFSESGFKYHTQFYNDTAPDLNPASRAEGEAIFNFDVVEPPASGRSCAVLSNIETNNNSQFGANSDYALFVETFFVVTSPALYEFRFGGDFGDGGELYLDDLTLEADWSNDLWWATNFANPDVLQGSRFLNAGTHTLKALGFERCCDGPLGIQFRIDTDGDGSLADETFADLDGTSTGINLLAPSCSVASATVGPVTTVPVTLSKFSSFKAGPFITFRWQTADESFNAGFDLWTLQSNGRDEEELVALNRRIIGSKGFDSRSTKHYKFRLHDRDQINNVVISSVDLNGDNEFFGPFDIGETYGGDIQSQKTDWQKIHASFQEQMSANGFKRIKNRWRKVRKNKSKRSENVQLTIPKNGIYRVTYEQLLALGADWNGVKNSDIALTHDGKARPRRIGRKVTSKRTSNRRKFGPGSYIDFVGQAASGSERIYSTERLYQLSIDPTETMSARLNKNVAKQPQSWAFKQERLSDELVYSLTSRLETPWLMSLIYRTGNDKTQEYTLNIPTDSGMRPEQAATLTVDLIGLLDSKPQDLDDDGETDPDHLVRVSLNGKVLKTIGFDGRIAQSPVLTIPNKLLKEGDNTVEVSVVDNGYRFDAVGVDALTLRYPVDINLEEKIDFLADSKEFDGLVFNATSKRGLVAYQYQENGNLMRLKISRDQSRPISIESGKKRFSVPFSALKNSRIVLASQFESPSHLELIPEANPINLSDVDMLIVSHPSFTGEALDNYVSMRRQQGIEALVVSTNEIAANYGLDVALPVAIKRFLIAADKQIDYQSVLLVGGHSYDYNNYLSDASISFIPSFYRSVYLVPYTPTDQPFVDFDDDGYPEKAIGRWPARTIEEVARIANKSLLWADAQATRSLEGHSMLLLADYERDLPFINGVEKHFELLANGNLSINSAQRLYLDELRSDTSIDQSNFNAEVQSKAKASIENGATWLLYGGHGSPYSWSPANFISSAKIKDIDNQNAPVMITSLACYTTYFENPSHNSLAHQLLFADGAENNGAAIIQGPTMVGGYQNQLELAKKIARHSVKGVSIGDAVLKGMESLPVNYINAIRNWALLADPTLPVQ